MDHFESTFDEAFLREALLQHLVHPDDTGTLLRYAPVALTHLCWRNTVLEDWHVGPESRISDAEMMRANAATTRIFHQSLWFALGESWAEVGPYDSDLIHPGELDEAFADAFDTAFDLERRLPHGVTLGELGGDESQELVDHAELQLGALVGMAEKYGANVVVMWLGLRGLSSVPFWWSTPRWPFVVDELFRRLDDPGHQHWRVGGPPGPPPAPADDRAWFREMLLVAPDQLPTEVIDYCIHDAAIGFMGPDPWARI